MRIEEHEKRQMEAVLIPQFRPKREFIGICLPKTGSDICKSRVIC